MRIGFMGTPDFARAHLEALGASRFDGYTETVYDGFTHDWGAFRRGMRDFAQLIFKTP